MLEKSCKGTLISGILKVTSVSLIPGPFLEGLVHINIARIHYVGEENRKYIGILSRLRKKEPNL